MTTISLATKQQQAIKGTLPFESAKVTQQRFGKEVYQFLLDALRGLPEGSVLTLSMNESTDKEASLVVQKPSNTEGPSQATELPHDALFLTEVNKYIAENIANESLSIDDLTHKCAMSRSQLFRKIKTLTAKTPAQLIRDYRLDTAHRLFQANKSKRVSEVMFAVGFNDAKHFGQIFKQRFGMSPQAIRR